MTDTAPAVEIRDLTVRFGTFTAVDGVGFTVGRGEIFGFLGANGAGKTTTIRVMCGLLRPSHGTVRIAGAGFEDGTAAIKRKVGYMSQKFTLYNDLTVMENLRFKADLRKMPGEAVRRRIDELFRFIGFSYPVETLVGELPGGVKQQVSLAATLLHDPEIVFLDEPTAGVSPAVRARFWALIRQLSGEGKTVIVTTHYMDEAEQCGRIALMRAGRLIALDTPDALKRDAYPEPLAELAPAGGARRAAEALSADPAVVRLWPYGMKYHAVLRDAEAWRELEGRLPEGVTMRRIPPSLEDVFIRLVEGADR